LRRLGIWQIHKFLQNILTCKAQQGPFRMIVGEELVEGYSLMMAVTRFISTRPTMSPLAKYKIGPAEIFGAVQMPFELMHMHLCYPMIDKYANLRVRTVTARAPTYLHLPPPTPPPPPPPTCNCLW